MLNRRVVDESDRHGLSAVTRLVLSNEILGLDEDFEMENDAKNAEAQVPGKDPVDVSQIDGAGVDGQVAGPKRAGDNDERQERGDGKQEDDSANGDAFLVPFVAGDGQVAIESGQREAEQQDGGVDGSQQNEGPAGQVVFVDDDGQLEDALGQEEALDQRNGSPEDVARVAQLS